jgi:hypothetical protein
MDEEPDPKFDINGAIDCYSQSFGNRIEPLRQLCRDPEMADHLAAEICALQSSIVDLVWSRAGEVGLSMHEIEQVARECLATRPEINEIGLNGLLRYVVWLAWHEGYLRRE